jgi:hypothetical protein
MTGYYRNLVKLKHANKALWNGDEGGPMVKIATDKDSSIYAFSREKDNSRVVVLLNLTKKSVAIKSLPENLNGEYTDYFGGSKATLPLADSLRFEPWGFKIFIK